MATLARAWAFGRRVVHQTIVATLARAWVSGRRVVHPRSGERSHGHEGSRVESQKLPFFFLWPLSLDTSPSTLQSILGVGL